MLLHGPLPELQGRSSAVQRAEAAAGVSRPGVCSESLIDLFQGGATLSDFQASFPIESLRFESGGGKYEIILYQRGPAFYAAWYCRHCHTREVTGDQPSGGAAKRAAQDAIGVHHSEQHRTGMGV